MAALYTIPAKRDLVEIWVYIAEDNMDAADEMDSRIRQVCDKLDQSPALGKLRPELGVAIRTFGVGNYVIYYRMTPDGVRILRIAHGARDAFRLFGLK